MRTKMIRCYKTNVPTHVGTQEIYFCLPDFYSRELYSCLVCGAIFTVEEEDERIYKTPIAALKANKLCPNCNSPLAATLKPYPKDFLGNDGEIRHYNPGSAYPPDSESIVKEVWHLYS